MTVPPQPSGGEDGLGEGTDPSGAVDLHAGPLLTKSEAADLLRLSPRSIQRLVANREIDAYYIGKNLRLRRLDIERYLARSRVPADAALLTRGSPRAGDSIDPCDIGSQAVKAGIRRIFKSRVEDAAYKAAVSEAFGQVNDGGYIRIMSNSLRFLLIVGPEADLTLALPMRDALKRGVRFQLLLLDPDSPAARTRASVERGKAFSATDEAFYESHLYRDIITAAEALDDEIRRGFRDPSQVQVRFSRAEPTTHLVLTERMCFVENYHSGGDREIQQRLSEQGIRDLHCFGGFIPVLLYDSSCLAGRLIQSHFEHSWTQAADGPDIADVLAQATANGSRSDLR